MKTQQAGIPRTGAYEVLVQVLGMNNAELIEHIKSKRDDLIALAGGMSCSLDNKPAALHPPNDNAAYPLWRVRDVNGREVGYEGRIVRYVLEKKHAAFTSREVRRYACA